ncbi:MAG: hypothetical protein H7X92_10670 [Chitinophagales bacterium]|nr:hypothetical protein [Hyphomicrobiales bacterium]
MLNFTKFSSTNLVRLGLTALFISSALAGCGKKGTLEAPSAEAKSEKKDGEEKADGEKGKKKQDTASSVGKGSATVIGKGSGTGKIENKPSQYPTGPHRPFILDGLL